MSLIRQIWVLLLGTLLLVFLTSATVNLLSARDTLETQLRLKNNDNAIALALVLSQQKGQPDLMELAASAQFDAGYYRLIRFIATDGKVLFVREKPQQPQRAPAWFVKWVPIESVPGVAQVSDGWHALGRIEIVSQAAYAHDQLWQGSLHAGLALVLVGLFTGLLATLGVLRIWRPLDDTVAQAAALGRGEYLTVAEPDMPELRRVTRAMNSSVARLRSVFEAQARQLEALCRQANCDPLTGLVNRNQFMARFRASLLREDGQDAGGLVLLRVLHLAELNRAFGHAETDRLLCTIAATLQDWNQPLAGSYVGRLNGSDFSMALPNGGTALRCAEAALARIRQVLGPSNPPVQVVAGAIDAQHGMPLAELLSAADLALAEAESAGAYTVRFGTTGAVPWATLGECAWREQVREALAEGRVRLASFPVVDAGQRLVHLECPLRLQLEPQGPFVVAARWLPLAVRGHLTGDADERALALALDAIAHDGQPRCVNVSLASLTVSGFAARLRSLLQARPGVASKVWIEVGETAAVEHFEGVRELGGQLRPTGARFGLEHAGEHLAGIEHLFEAGLDYVKLDAAVCHGIAADAGRSSFVKGLVTMLHGLSLQAFAEGVDDAGDAQALWDLGIDAITGPVTTLSEGQGKDGIPSAP